MRWYASKVDWWIGMALWIAPLVSVGVCVALALGPKRGELIIGIVMALFVAALYIALVLPIRYGLDEKNLVVRFGICRQRIRLSDIRSVEPTRNPLSSPALSLDRLAVKYGPGFFGSVMISPGDRDAFLDELAELAGLIRHGDCLVRA